MSSQRIGKYACLEIEKKYLLSKLPLDLDGHESHWQITDRYLANTRLRLRWMVSPATDQVIFKLAQKYRAAAQDPTQTTITNLYLSAEEYQRLASLDARQLVKQRYEYLHQGRQYSIDVFEGALIGLILAEIECETTEEVAQLPFPDFALRDVTVDPFFAGGALATLDHETFQAGLAERFNAVHPSLNAEQLHLKDEGGVGRDNPASAGLAIA